MSREKWREAPISFHDEGHSRCKMQASREKFLLKASSAKSPIASLT
jgi:hypothetical protein